jgi:diguanylate cyclase (GGDEF)-like protein
MEPTPRHSLHPLSEVERWELALIERSRSAAPADERPDRRAVNCGAAAFLVAVVALVAVERPAVGAGDVLNVLAGVAAFAIASSVEFEIGTASAAPTVPVLVALLVLLPPALAPPVAAVGLVVGASLISRQTGRRQPLAATLCSALHVVGPAALVAAVGWPAGTAGWAVLAGVVAAGLASDLALSSARNRAGLGLSGPDLLSMLRWTYAVDVTLAPLGFLAAAQLGPQPVAFAVTLMPVALLALLAIDRRRQVDRLLLLDGAFDEAHAAARRDPLTGLGNRLAWEEALAAATARAGDPIAIVLLDVDRLKLVNDRYGHPAGDRLIQSVSSAMAAEIGPGSVVCRIGGDEFGIVLSGATATTHHEVVERVQRAVAKEPSVGDVPVSVSIGSSVAVGRGVHEAVSIADDELYRAKRARSDRTAAGSPLLPQRAASRS